MSKEVGHGWVEASEGSCVGADGGSPEGDRSRRRRRGGWVGGLGARPAVERKPETGRGVAATTGVNTVNAPAGTMLDARTTYFVFLSYSGNRPSIYLIGTQSTSADSGEAADWRIHKLYDRSRAAMGAWSENARATKAKFKVNGRILIPPGLEVTLQLSHDRILEFPTPVTVTATVSPASPVAFTVAISATPVAPATAADFRLSTIRVLRFAADATASTGTVTITPVDDDVPEPHDVVRVSGAVSNAAIPDPDDVTVEIINNDPEDYDVEVSAPPAVDEGAGAAVVTVTLTTRRNTAPVATVDIFFDVEGGTAARGDDYTPPDGRDFGTGGIHFTSVQPSAFSPNAAGTAWVAEPSFTIGIIDDQEDERDETIVFTIDLSEVTSPAHTITIRDNDATPAVSIAADHPTVVEEQPAAFTLTRTGATGSPLTVTVAVSEQADRDLLPDGAAAERTVRFGAGAATTALTVALENDRIAEADGDLTVAVKAGAGYTPGDPSSATVTVEDGDTDMPPPTVTSVVVASTPQSGDTSYRWGETIVFTVTFSEPVRVTGRPGLEVGLDDPAGASGSTVQARFAGLSEAEQVTSDSGPVPVSRYVHFGYSVRPFDRDTDGVSLGANALRLASGDRIQSGETGTYAEFAHAALGPQSGHRVDGRKTVDGKPVAPVAEAGIKLVDTDGNPLELLANGTHRLSVPEGGEARYGLRLKTRPAHKVVVSLHYHTYGGDSDLTVPRNFSIDGSIAPDEWDTKTVWVRVEAAQDDDAEDGERVFDNRAFSNDPNYHDLVLPDVVVVEADDDKESSSPGSVAEPLTASFEGLPSSHDGATAFSFRLAFSEAVAVTPEAMRTAVLDVAGGAVTGAARVGGASGVWAITVTPDSREELSITLAPAADCAADCAVCTSDGRALSNGAAHIVPGPGPETDTQQALTARFEGLPEAHDGEEAFRFRVAFSEDIGISYKTLRDDAFTVSGGAVTGARRVDGRHDLWEITVTPASDEAVTVTLSGDRACGTAGAVCTRGDDPSPLANSPSATVAGPAYEPEPNTAAAGAPTIGGTPRVGEELTASTSGISDADGLDNADFAYQWVRTDTDIQGATGATYTAVDADEGKELKVRVSFTDDAGNAESLTSAATDAVAARPEPLTASFEGMPAEHAGQGSFSFRVAFSDGINISYKTVRDASFTVTGGEVTAARRVDKRRDLWQITIAPASHEALTVRLPETTNCGATGAICTSDGRPLSHSLSATVAGPVGISVADARVEEGADAVLAFAVTLSRAASAALTVDYATADGSAHAGDDYRAASGTLTFAAGESSQTIEVAVLDDAHDEGEETLTLTLSNASSGRLTDGEATGTIKNSDPLPRALLARFGRTAALHVVEHVEERLQAPREPGFRGRFAGRELRRGMERDIALNFLRQLGGTAGAGPLGAGAHGSLSGAPAAGTAPLGMPGPAGGGHLAAASGRMGGAMPMGGARGAMGMAAGPLDGGFNGGGLLRMGLGGGDVLTGSDFALGRETRHGGILSIWSRGAQSRFSGREGALSLGGDVRTTMFGADYAKGPLVTGLSLSHSRGLGEYAGVAGGQVASSVTGLYPWLGYKATDRITVWGVAGYGAGGLLLTPQGGPALASGLSMAMAAAGTRGELVSGGAGGFALAFKADTLWVGTSIDGVDGPAGRLKATEAAVTRFRTGLEGSRAYTLAGRLSLKPSVEVGLRHDGGDAETGAGMDVGAGLVVSDAGSGLAVDVRVRTLVMHQAEGFRERGVALSLSYNPTPSTPLGFVARVAPSWGGQATSGAEALWGRQTMGGMAPGGVASGNRLDGEVGYGLPVGSRFVGTPRVGFSTSEHGRDYRLGYGLGMLNRESLSFELGIDAQRRESPLLDGTDQGALARATVRW